MTSGPAEKKSTLAENDLNLAFVKRAPFVKEGAGTVSALMVCAERPNVDIVSRIIRSIAKAPSVTIAEDFYTLYELRKEWNRERFESEYTRLMQQIRADVEATGWQPEAALQEGLYTHHLTSSDNVSKENDWMENYGAQIRAIRYCHLRSIAKKGADLDDTKHFTSHFTSVEDPANQARLNAAFEVLSVEDIRGQAEELVEQALSRVHPVTGEPFEILCMRPVKNYDNHTNSYNFLTATYAQLLRSHIQEVFEEKYPGFEIQAKDHPVMMLTQTNRTDASPFGRILKQPLFEVEGVEGKNVLVIDDHVNAGAFCATLASQAEAAGGIVIGIATFSRHPNSKSLELLPELKAALIDLYESTLIDELLEKVGLSVDSLTNREGLTLLAIFSDADNTAQYGRFWEIAEMLDYKDKKLVPGIKDNLENELHQPPESIASLRAAINAMFQSGKVR